MVHFYQVGLLSPLLLASVPEKMKAYFFLAEIFNSQISPIKR